MPSIAAEKEIIKHQRGSAPRRHFKVFVTVTYALLVHGLHPSSSSSTSTTTAETVAAAAPPTCTPPSATCSSSSIRRFSASVDTTFEEFLFLLRATVLSRLPPEGAVVLALHYHDSDGDRVEVTNELEWAEALLHQQEDEDEDNDGNSRSSSGGDSSDGEDGKKTMKGNKKQHLKMKAKSKKKSHRSKTFVFDVHADVIGINNSTSASAAASSTLKTLNAAWVGEVNDSNNYDKKPLPTASASTCLRYAVPSDSTTPQRSETLSSTAVDVATTVPLSREPSSTSICSSSDPRPPSPHLNHDDDDISTAPIAVVGSCVVSAAAVTAVAVGSAATAAARHDDHREEVVAASDSDSDYEPLSSSSPRPIFTACDCPVAEAEMTNNNENEEKSAAIKVEEKTASTDSEEAETEPSTAAAAAVPTADSGDEEEEDWCVVAESAEVVGEEEAPSVNTGTDDAAIVSEEKEEEQETEDTTAPPQPSPSPSAAEAPTTAAPTDSAHYSSEEAVSETPIDLYFEGHPAIIIVTDVGSGCGGAAAAATATIPSASITANNNSNSNAVTTVTATSPSPLPPQEARESAWPHFHPHDAPMVRLLSLLFDCDAATALLDPFRRVNFGALVRRYVDPFATASEEMFRHTTNNTVTTTSYSSTAAAAAAAVAAITGSSGEGSGAFRIEFFRDQIRSHTSFVATRLMAGLCTASSSSSSRDDSANNNNNTPDPSVTIALLETAVIVFPRDATLWFHLACARAAAVMPVGTRHMATPTTTTTRTLSATTGDDFEIINSPITESDAGAATNTTRNGEGDDAAPTPAIIITTAPPPPPSMPAAAAAPTRADVVAALRTAIIDCGYADLQQVLDEPLLQALDLFSADAAAGSPQPQTGQTLGSAAAAAAGTTTPSSAFTALMEERLGGAATQLLIMYPRLSVAEAKVLLSRFGNNLHSTVSYLLDQ